MSNIKAYVWKNGQGNEHIITVDVENDHVHIYQANLYHWFDDEWTGDLQEGRRWYKIWRDLYGQPEVCGG